MSTLQGICGGRVILHRELGWLPTVNRVARSALAAIGSFRKLTVVRVGLVAIHAFLKRKRLLEIPAAVAPNAADARVFSNKWKFRLGVVEFLVERLY
jgi:hypothetical protein